MSCSHTKLGLPASQRGRLAGWLTVRLVRHSLITQAGPSSGEVKSTVWYGVTMDIVVCKCALCTVHSQYIFTCCPAGLTAGSHNLISNHHYQHTAINPPDYNCCLRFSLELGIEIIQSISPFKLMFWIRFMKLLELCPHIWNNPKSEVQFSILHHWLSRNPGQIISQYVKVWWWTNYNSRLPKTNVPNSLCLMTWTFLGKWQENSFLLSLAWAW